MRISQPLVRLSVAAVAACAVAIATLTHAPVSSADDLRAQIADANAQLETLGMKAEAALEDLQGARLHLNAVNDKLARTQAAVAEAQAEVESAQQDIGKFAASAYRSGGLDYNLQVFLADDPQQFLDQATILGILADTRSASLRRSQTASLRLAQLTAELQQQQAEAEAGKAEMAKRKQDSDQAVADMQAYLDGLNEELRQQIIEERRAEQAAAAERARQEAAAAQAQQQNQGNSGNATGGGNGGAGGPDWNGDVVGSDRAAIAVQAALSQLGKPYRPMPGAEYYATPPDSFDCTKLTSWAWAQAGVQLTPWSYAQAQEVQRIDAADLQPGDLLFFFEDGNHHASMYIGGGQIIEANSAKGFVSITDLWNDWNSAYFSFAGRPYT